MISIHLVYHIEMDTQSNMWLHIAFCCARITEEVEAMKKWDIVFAVVVLIVSGAIASWYIFLGKQDAGEITITVENEIYGTYLLSEEQEIMINDTNLLIIKENEADMIDANCPNKECVHQKSISKKGEAITCLPNKIIVEVTSGETAQLDGVAN